MSNWALSAWLVIGHQGVRLVQPGPLLAFGELSVSCCALGVQVSVHLVCRFPCTWCAGFRALSVQVSVHLVCRFPCTWCAGFRALGVQVSVHLVCRFPCTWCAVSVQFPCTWCAVSVHEKRGSPMHARTQIFTLAKTGFQGFANTSSLKRVKNLTSSSSYSRSFFPS
jgi:hypothetical protein